MMKTDGSIGVIESPVLAHRKKLPILISTDSACDLPNYLVEKYQIAVMPYRVFTERGEFMDDIEIEIDGILSYMEDKEKYVRSGPPQVANYEEFFAEQLAKAQCVIHIALAKNASKAYDNALEASKTFDNVMVIDSGHLSSGLGLMALFAAEQAENGLSADSIAKELEHVKKRVKSSFIVTDTEYLTRSGRMPDKINNLCRALMIHPVIVLKNSSMKVGSLRVGTREYAWKQYIKVALNTIGEIDKKMLFITYVGLTNDELKIIEEMVNDRMSFEQVICQKASPAIATNCGPGTFGLLFRIKE